MKESYKNAIIKAIKLYTPLLPKFDLSFMNVVKSY